MAAKTEDLPGVEGPGVSPVKDKKLNALADEFTEKRDEKANLAEEMTGIETKILDRMDEIGVRVFKYADRVVTIKDGKRHVKIKQVKTGDEDGSQD